MSKIVYASGRKILGDWWVVCQEDNYLIDRFLKTQTEEYWRARIITGMTSQKDPFFYRDEYLKHNYGKNLTIS